MNGGKVKSLRVNGNEPARYIKHSMGRKVKVP